MSGEMVFDNDMSAARIHTDRQIDALDMLAEYPTTEVRGGNLRTGMVLVDPDFSTPVAMVDHRIAATRGSGAARYMLADLENGGWFDRSFHLNVSFRVIAK